MTNESDQTIEAPRYPLANDVDGNPLNVPAEAVAWRIRVLNSAGDVADDKVLKSVVVELGDGQKLPAHYGPHGKPPTDYFWSLHWNIPVDFPTGSLGYKVIATMMDDTTQTWEPFMRAPSQLTVIAGEPEMKN